MAGEAAHNHVSVRVNDQREIGTSPNGYLLQIVQMAVQIRDTLAGALRCRVWAVSEA
jgi:hypothetical protein